MATTSAAQVWFTPSAAAGTPDLRLFCFPYAGGAETIFRSWGRHLPGEVKVCPAQLPGRGRRLGEQALTDLRPLVDHLAEAIAPHLDTEFAFFGHSMGAIIAFELAHRLRREHGREPAHLFVSGRAAPHLPNPRPPTYDLPKEKLVEELRRLNGTPQEVLEHPELLEFLIPLLRADFELVETYRYTPRQPLGCPITAFGGTDDVDVPRASVEDWGRHTTGAFQLLMLPGDHFFLLAEQDRLLRAISAALSGVKGGSNGGPSAAVPAASCPPSNDPASHLVTLGEGEWAAWRCVALRGAGFPAADVLRLASPECAAAADRLVGAEAQAERAREEALDEVRRALDLLRAEGVWDDGARRAPLLKALRALSKGSLPGETDGRPFAASTSVFGNALLRVEVARQQLSEAFSSAQKRVSQAVSELARGERFREAVVWQNRRAYHTCVRPLGEETPGSDARGSKRRQHEEMVASYLQRYCVKNDTIGFFGPVGWATLSRSGEVLSQRPGQSLTAERNIYFEVWAIDALAARLSELDGIKGWLAPRLLPYARVEGDRIVIPSKGSVELTPEQAAILRACDGVRPAREVAAVVLRNVAEAPADEQEVYDFLELMEGSGLIAWGLEVPMQLRPERTLRRQLERVGDRAIRERALLALGELEEARSDVARARGHVEALDRALGRLESTFTRLTGSPPTRAAGATYAARTLLFEDCRRDGEVELGLDLVAELAPSLSLLLTSARWLTREAAELYRAAFLQIHDELARRGGSGRVDLVGFWAAAQPLLSEGAEVPLPAARRFQEHWARILEIPDGARRVQYTSAKLRPLVERAFRAAAPGWPQARHHSPDVMIAAAGPEAFARGDYYFVLGELHLGLNTVTQNLFVAQHPAPEEIYRAVRADIPEACVSPVISKANTFLLSARLMSTLLPDKDYWINFDPDPADSPPERTLRSGELFVEREADTLRVCTADGRLGFDILDVAAEFFAVTVADRFKLLEPKAHTPRVTVDRTVVSRESWNFPTEELAFVEEKSPAARFVAARRWARGAGLPRFVFVKLASEVKPFYLDFDSPVYVDIFARLVRRAAESGRSGGRVSVSEMLPAHEETWLADAQGRTYTSELRLVAVDLSGRRVEEFR